METVKFKYDTKNSLQSTPISNGTIHAVIDTGELHIDTEGTRIKITDIEVHETEAARRALLAPKAKFHYCKDSGNLWFKNGVWKLVGQQGVTKTIAIPVTTTKTTSEDVLEENWLVKHVVFVPDVPFTDSEAVINISIAGQQLIPEGDLHPESIIDQYESTKYTKVLSSGKVEVNPVGASAGSGTLYIEYSIM